MRNAVNTPRRADRTRARGSRGCFLFFRARSLHPSANRQFDCRRSEGPIPIRLLYIRRHFLIQFFHKFGSLGISSYVFADFARSFYRFGERWAWPYALEVFVGRLGPYVLICGR